jgi:hypothetical protein
MDGSLYIVAANFSRSLDRVTIGIDEDLKLLRIDNQTEVKTKDGSLSLSLEPGHAVLLMSK